jgi:hypothetical protein
MFEERLRASASSAPRFGTEERGIIACGSVRSRPNPANSKFEIKNPKQTRIPKYEIPNRFEFDYWDLEFVWDFLFRISNFLNGTDQQVAIHPALQYCYQ